MVICRIAYLLTPWCRVLFEKLTGLQLVKKFPAFHGTRKFITALTSVSQLSLSWASPIQSTSWRSILILSTHLRLGLPSGLLPSGFLTKTRYTPISVLRTIRNISGKSCRENQNTPLLLKNIACWIHKVTNTHSESVTLIAFPLQYWFSERTRMSRLYVHCLSCLNFIGKHFIIPKIEISM